MKCKTMKPNADGWSDWTQPRHEKYHLQCCDCGLVHEMQFRVVKDAEPIDAEALAQGLVLFRARRGAEKGKG